MRLRALVLVVGLLAVSSADLDFEFGKEADPTIRNAPAGTPSPPPFDPQTDRTEAIPGFTPSTFAVIGDFGSKDAREKAVANRMCQYRNSHPFDHVFTTGDNVYSTGDPADFAAAFFDPMDCLLSGGVQFHASLGNHDVLTKSGLPQIRRDAFGIPSRNYVYRRDGVRFVVADSNSLNYTWLKKATMAKSDDHWTIVIFHHPVYSAGTGHGSTPDFAAKLTPLFERRGVDLVLNGHDHVYSVTREVRGIRYVVTGGGGARSYGCHIMPPMRKCIGRLHFLYIKASSNYLRVQAIPAKGPPMHTFRTRGRA